MATSVPFVKFIAFQLNNNIALIMPGQVRRKPLRKFALKHFNALTVKAVRVSHSFQSILYTTLQKKRLFNNLEMPDRMSSACLDSHLKFRDDVYGL